MGGTPREAAVVLSGELAPLAGLAASAFLAATLLPGGSEAVFAALLTLRPELTPAALLVATVANTAGGMSTYALGRLLPRKEPGAHARTLQRWGSLALLLSWVPLITRVDHRVTPPLCAAAGALRLNAFACLAWMALGKGLRYAAIAWALPSAGA